MNHTALITSEKKHEYPILIIDKKGLLGEALANELKSESFVVLVSKSISAQNENILHIPFVKKFPTIPDNIYSHIFFIDEELEITKEIINPFIKKAKKDNAFLIFALNKEFAKEELVKTIFNSYDNLKLVLIGDIFSQNEIYNSKTAVNQFIYQAKSLGKIEVPGDGGDEASPVYFEDVISGLLESAFFQDKNHKLYYLFPKQKTTLLMLAHMFQKKDPNLKIGFINETKVKAKNEFILQDEGKYLLEDSYSIMDRIKKINFQNLTTDKYNNYKENNNSKGFNISFVFVFLISFLFLPLITSLLFTFIGFNSLYIVKTTLDKNNYTLAKASASFSLQSFTIARKSAEILAEEVSVVGQRRRVEDFKKKIDLGIETSSGIVSVIGAAQLYKKIAEGISQNPSSDFLIAQTEFKNALYLYSKGKESEIIPDSIKTKLKDVIKISSATIDFWPDIFGFNGQKTYLVLFQNNMELRPGGGFIGSYGILNLKKGRVVNFKIYDVYDADGQLKTHVEPPFPIRRFLPSVHWYLRDSNFNLDFSKGAVASAIFLNSEMQQAVDGVIGVDLFFVRELLLAIGPVYVSDYKQEVSADNFYQITQSHAEKDFFPGSTQKKDFLRSFYNALVAKLTTDKNLSSLELLNSITNSIYEKHILFAFNNPNIQTAFAINGWSSALFDERKKEKGIINDFMGINEANLGANKVNYYITRSLSQNVLIDEDGVVSENLTISLKNSSPKEAYRNYLRIALPTGTSINKIIIDGKEQKIVDAIEDPVVYEKKNFNPPVGLEVKKENQAENSIYGFLVNINSQQLMVIQVFYELPEKLILSKPEFSYSLKLFKQPGIDYYPYELSLTYPSSFKVINSPGDAKVALDRLTLSSQITRDKELQIGFGAK